MLHATVKDLETHLDKAIEALTRELIRIRTGRANANLLDGVRVDYYGTATPLNQVAVVTVADPRLLIVKPWEKRLLVVIEKAIRDASLGLNPTADTEIVRVPIPALTQDRRKELSKTVKRLGEDAKVAIRNCRRDSREIFEKAKKDGILPEDDMEQGFKKIQLATDRTIEKADELIQKKEAEILEG